MRWVVLFCYFGGIMSGLWFRTKFLVIVVFKIETNIGSRIDWNVAVGWVKSPSWSGRRKFSCNYWQFSWRNWFHSGRPPPSFLQGGISSFPKTFLASPKRSEERWQKPNITEKACNLLTCLNIMGQKSSPIALLRLVQSIELCPPRNIKVMEHFQRETSNTLITKKLDLSCSITHALHWQSNYSIR